MNTEMDDDYDFKDYSVEEITFDTDISTLVNGYYQFIVNFISGSRFIICPLGAETRSTSDLCNIVKREFLQDINQNDEYDVKFIQNDMVLPNRCIYENCNETDVIQEYNVIVFNKSFINKMRDMLKDNSYNYEMTWFDDYRQETELDIKFLYSYGIYKNEENSKIAEDFFVGIFGMEFISLRYVELIDVALTPNILNSLKLNKNIREFSIEYYEYGNDDNDDENEKIIFDLDFPEFYDCIRSNDVLQTLSFIGVKFDSDRFLNALYENKNLLYMNISKSPVNIATKIKQFTDKFIVTNVLEIPFCGFEHELNQGELFFNCNTIKYKLKRI